MRDMKIEKLTNPTAVNLPSSEIFSRTNNDFATFKALLQELNLIQFVGVGKLYYDEQKSRQQSLSFKTFLHTIRGLFKKLRQASQSPRV